MGFAATWRAIDPTEGKAEDLWRRNTFQMENIIKPKRLIVLLYFPHRTVTNAAPCGGVFSGNQGEMMSPNWPTGNYPALSVCTWRISIPSNTSIHVGFSHFDLQAKNLLGTCSDYVDVINGENMETLGRLLLHLRSWVSTHCCGLMLLLLVLVVVVVFNRVQCCFFHVQVGSAVPPLLPTSPFLATQLSSASLATQPIRKRVSVVTGRQMPVLSQLCLLQPLSHRATTITGGCLLCQYNTHSIWVWYGLQLCDFMREIQIYLMNLDFFFKLVVWYQEFLFFFHYFN